MRNLLLLTACLVISGATFAQDVPVYSQKLTNSFLYNPSVAGNTFGSATLSYRQQWTGASGAPQTSFLSLHTPFAKHRMGTGLNFYQETAGVNQSIYASAAFAYHIRFTERSMFSMGASGEYLSSKVNFNKIDALDPDDILLEGGQTALNKMDFSFGMSFHSRYLKIGASANRISGLLGIGDSTSQFPAFYTGYVNLVLPLSGDKHVLEPLAYIRNLSNGKNQFDAGLYYTYNDKYTFGGSYRTGGATSLTAAFKVGKNLLFGYSREMLTGEIGNEIRSSNEFTLRLDFRDHNYYSNSRNARTINTQALALRRKTMTKFPASRSPYTTSKRNKQFANRNYLKSPNYRMDSSKKLQTVKRKKSPYNKGYKKRRR